MAPAVWASTSVYFIYASVSNHHLPAAPILHDLYPWPHAAPVIMYDNIILWSLQWCTLLVYATQYLKSQEVDLTSKFCDDLYLSTLMSCTVYMHIVFSQTPIPARVGSDTGSSHNYVAIAVQTFSLCRLSMVYGIYIQPYWINIKPPPLRTCVYFTKLISIGWETVCLLRVA